MRFNPFVPHGPEPFTPTPKSGGPVLSTIEFFKKKIDELFRKDSTSVHYTHEDKTNEEKTIARDNIGAQEKLVSGVNLKTVRGQSLLGSGDVPQVPAEWGGIMGNLGMQTDLAEALGGKANRSDVYTKPEADAAIVANVENSVTSTSTTKALSANMGKELQDQIQNLKHSKADEAKPSFSTITINGVNYTEWTLGTRSGRIILSVDMGGISTEIAAFNLVTGVFVSAPGQYRNTLRFDGEAPVVGASPTLFDHVARESALSGKANISHTHTTSEITNFPTSMPPTAHSHASDGWFTSALEAVKVWADGVFAAITHSHASDSWFTSALEAIKSWASGAFAAITHSHAGDSWFTTALGRKLDVDGPTVESGMTVKGSIYSTGLYTRYDEGSTSTKYAPEHIENGEAVILLPSSSGTFALTSDVPDPVEVVDPASATEAGKAADALATKNALDGVITADDVKRVYNVNGTQYIDGDGGVYTAQFEKGGHWTKKQGSQNARFEYTGYDKDLACYRWKDTVNANHTCLYNPSTGKFSAFGSSIETGKKGLNPENGDDIGGPYTVVGATFTFFKQDSVFPSEPQDTLAKKSELDGKANSSDIPSLSGQTFDMSVDAQFKDMCIATARALGAVVTHTTNDTSTGGQVAQAYGITPTDATTFGELQTKAGLGDSAVIGDL